MPCTHARVQFVEMQPQRVRDVRTREEIHDWYTSADENGDGKLSVNEFFKWSLSGRVDGASVLERIFAKYDGDGSGTLSSDEFRKLAYDLGFGHAANEAFAVLDADGSGSISYCEVLAALQTAVPHNMETKKLLFGCIWTWGVNQADSRDKRWAQPRAEAARWRIRESEEGVFEELRALLRGSGAHVSDLCALFDDDASSVLSIDEVSSAHGFTWIESAAVVLLGLRRVSLR